MSDDAEPGLSRRQLLAAGTTGLIATAAVPPAAARAAAGPGGRRHAGAGPPHLGRRPGQIGRGVVGVPRPVAGAAGQDRAAGHPGRRARLRRPARRRGRLDLSRPGGRPAAGRDLRVRGHRRQRPQRGRPVQRHLPDRAGGTGGVPVHQLRRLDRGRAPAAGLVEPVRLRGRRGGDLPAAVPPAQRGPGRCRRRTRRRRRRRGGTSPTTCRPRPRTGRGCRCRATTGPSPPTGSGPSRSYLARYSLPGNGVPGFEGRWYEFRIGTAAFLCLGGDDARHGYSGGAQTRWLEAALAAARRDASIDWVVIQLHQCACPPARPRPGRRRRRPRHQAAVAAAVRPVRGRPGAGRAQPPLRAVVPGPRLRLGRHAAPAAGDDRRQRGVRHQPGHGPPGARRR